MVLYCPKASWDATLKPFSNLVILVSEEWLLVAFSRGMVDPTRGIGSDKGWSG